MGGKLQIVQSWTADVAIEAAARAAMVKGQQNTLTSGQETCERIAATGAVTLGSGNMRVGYFTALKTETISALRPYTWTTAAGATPTLVRYGLYAAAADGALTSLLGSTPNDTALLNTPSLPHQKSLSVATPVVEGTRYAIGLLVVTAAAAPTVVATTAVATAGIVADSPRIVGLVSGQADLPSSVVAGSVANGTQVPYVQLIP